MTRLFFILALLFAVPATGQSFEGTIEWTESKGRSEFTLKMMVKDAMVRVETYSSGELKGVKLVDTKTGTVSIMVPRKKLYFVEPQKEHEHADYTMKKTGNVRAILGYDCEQIVIENTTLNRKVRMWVTKESFNFFGPLAAALFREGYEDYFITDAPLGMMPLEVTVMKGNGLELTERKVTFITSEKLDEMLFKVPDDYHLWER